MISPEKILKKKVLAIAISVLVSGSALAVEYDEGILVDDHAGGITIDQDMNVGSNNDGIAIKVVPGGHTGMVVNNGSIYADQSVISASGSGAQVGIVENNGHMESINGAAIYAGDGARLTTRFTNRGTIIGGMVNDEQVAIDISESGTTGRFAIENRGDGVIQGNIHLHAKTDSQHNGNKAVVEFRDTAGSESGKAVFDGKHISGVNQVRVYDNAWAKFAAQDETINIDLVNFTDSTNGDQSTQGSFDVGAESTLELELHADRSRDDSVLHVSNGDINFSNSSEEGKKSTIYLTGNLEDIHGEHILVSVDDDNNINGHYEFGNGWLTTVTEVGDSEDGNITVDVEYNEQASSETLRRDAAAGGADATEISVIGAFGEIALDNAEINEEAILDEDGNPTGETRTIITFGNAQDLADLMNLAGTDDPERAARLAGELTPDRSGATLHASQYAMGRQLDNVNRRMNALHADDSAGRYGGSDSVWFSAYGSKGSRDVDGRIDGYDIKGMGFTVGTDGLMTDNIRAGFAFGYSNQETSGSLYDTEHEIETYQLTAYSLFYLDGFFVNASAGMGMNSYDSTRTIGQSLGYTGETRAEARYDGYFAAARVMAGKDFTFSSTRVQPVVGAEINRVVMDAYEEKGSPASLGYDKQTVDQLKLGLGANVYHDFNVSKGILTGSLSTMAWHDFNADQRDLKTYTTIDPSTGGTITTANGSAENRFNIDAGLSYVASNNVVYALDLSHTIEDNFNDTSLQLKARFDF